MYCLEFRIWGFRMQCLGLGFKVLGRKRWVFGFRCADLESGFKVHGKEDFGVWGLGFRVWGLGFRRLGFRGWRHQTKHETLERDDRK